RSSGSTFLSKREREKAALRSACSQELICTVLPHSTPVRVVAPLGEVTPASPLKVSSLLSFNRNTSRVVFQRGTGSLAKPTSALVARVSAVTGCASRLSPLRVTP